MNATVNALLRADLRDFGGYKSARSDLVDGNVWLNANESAWANPSDADATLRRYPDPQPRALRSRLAALYDVEPAQLLVGRGSDEAIDLLVRAFCAPGQGAIAIAPPVFGMYAVCARLHGARVIDVPLVDGEQGLRVDLQALGDAALANGASLVFLCTPGNPSGEALPLIEIASLAVRLRGKALVVVDEAYAEYSDVPSATALFPAHENIAVLRTLSKAHALAAARVGSVLGAPALRSIAMLQRCQAPYPMHSNRYRGCAVKAMAPQALASTVARVSGKCASERERLAPTACAGVPQVLPRVSLVREFPAGPFPSMRMPRSMQLLAAGVVVRDMRAMPQLGDALRITVGTPDETPARAGGAGCGSRCEVAA
jgi:histidinol-phosphate aminotransferase